MPDPLESVNTAITCLDSLKRREEQRRQRQELRRKRRNVPPRPEDSATPPPAEGAVSSGSTEGRAILLDLVG